LTDQFEENEYVLSTRKLEGVHTGEKIAQMIREISMYVSFFCPRVNLLLSVYIMCIQVMQYFSFDNKDCVIFISDFDIKE
jgi:hypothetical protein